MIDRFFIGWSLCATLLTGGMLILTEGERLRQRRRIRDAALRARYLRIVMLSLLGGNGPAPRFPQLRHARARLLLAETVAGVTGATYGLDPEPLRRIVDENRLDRCLLLRARRARGYRRARYLALLSHLPAEGQISVRTLRYARSRNAATRFYVLLTRLTADVRSAVRLIDDYPAPFTAGEVAEIMTVLRRGLLPIAYEPLLHSPDRNLRMVGLEIVRRFGIEEAERHIMRIVEEEPDPEVCREALYTLCSMLRPMRGAGTLRRIASMHPPGRKALLRYMVAEGYSVEALRRIADIRDRPYYESLVRSYKRVLA